jgi:hypothetical protein
MDVAFSREGDTEAGKGYRKIYWRYFAVTMVRRTHSGVTRGQAGSAWLIRVAEGTPADEELNLRDIQKGKRPNPTLYAGGHPFSWAKNLVTAGARGIAPSATSAVIYAAP